MLGNFQFLKKIVDSSSYKSSQELVQFFKKNSNFHTHSNFQNVPRKIIANFLEKSNFKLIEIKMKIL